MPDTYTLKVSATNNPFGSIDGSEITINRYAPSAIYEDNRTRQVPNEGDHYVVDENWGSFVSFDDTDKSVGETLNITYYTFFDIPAATWLTNNAPMGNPVTLNYAVTSLIDSEHPEPISAIGFYEIGTDYYISSNLPGGYVVGKQYCHGDESSFYFSDVEGLTVASSNNTIQSTLESINWSEFSVDDELLIVGSNGHFIKGTIQSLDTSASNTGTAYYGGGYVPPGANPMQYPAVYQTTLSMTILITELSSPSSAERGLSVWGLDTAGISEEETIKPCGPFAISKLITETNTTTAVGNATQISPGVWGQVVADDVYTDKDVRYHISINKPIIGNLNTLK